MSTIHISEYVCVCVCLHVMASNAAYSIFTLLLFCPYMKIRKTEQSEHNLDYIMIFSVVRTTSCHFWYLLL